MIACPEAVLDCRHIIISKQIVVAIIIIIIHLDFFASASADGFSLKLEWLQIPSSIQDSSKYSSRLQ